ncbi:hypothetical protein KP509_06G082000 [Ceratopteris richardii]|uniref:DUF3253 domain-containing protein n=1 Tax=Ceratopteris richardii TaxID=49495 RepID=A0A8T2UIC3_CERRI|nr:hypothetical protein KP509_06G082000 [Ceratopteris richardii]
MMRKPNRNNAAEREEKHVGDYTEKQNFDGEVGVELEQSLEQKILEILGRRAASSTMCPSEAARAISPSNWRLLMERTRQVARTMALRGIIHITQKGVVCNPLTDFKGPIRLKLAAK